jgi:tripartite-type tricarboxylate transporter receptor subunit TctC
MGGLAPGTFPSDNARAQTALGINLKIVDGFKGVTEVRLATRAARWTVPALLMKACSFFPNSRPAISGSSRRSEKPWPGLKTCPTLSIWPERAEQGLLRVAVIGPNDINRLFTLPAGVPADRVAAMRKAFDATFADPEFQADIEKARVVLRRISVERIQEVALLWLDMPAADKKELQKILKIN